MSRAHNTARCYGSGKKTGALVWPYDADYMLVTPTFCEGRPDFVVCPPREGKKIEKNKSEEECKREQPGFVDVYCCQGRICFSTRTESEPKLWEDGFYFEVFPPIVRYCRELLLHETWASYVKRGFVFCSWRTSQIFINKCVFGIKK